MSETGEPAARPAVKGPSAFRTIGEVAEDLDLPTHVLRFWESKFPQLKPLKRSGGRRYYRPEDILLLRRIRQSLYQDGYTIRGVQKLLADDDSGPEAAATGGVTPSLFAADPAPQAAADEIPAPAKPARRPRPPRSRPETKAALEEIRRELLDVRALLEELRRNRQGA